MKLFAFTIQLFVLTMLSITLAQDPGAETIYQVFDPNGNLIFETQRPIVVKKEQKPVKLVTLPGDSSADNVKAVLDAKLGAPKKIILYYTSTYEDSNGVHIELNKHPNGSKLIANYLGQQWLMDNIPALKEDLKDKPKDKPKVISPPKLK